MTTPIDIVTPAQLAGLLAAVPDLDQVDGTAHLHRRAVSFATSRTTGDWRCQFGEEVQTTLPSGKRLDEPRFLPPFRPQQLAGQPVSVTLADGTVLRFDPTLVQALIAHVYVALAQGDLEIVPEDLAL